MKIGPLENKPPVAPVAGERPGTASRPGSGVSDEASAKVELSAAAMMMDAEASADFDAEKVQRIALAIREGRFRVDAEAIADRLIANAQELLGSRSH
jgi:negative regulator of flagellin synthesis FlgM